MNHRALYVVSLTALAACWGEDTTNPRTGTPPSFVISDATHSGGNRGFFWLPPMVSNPSSSPDWNENGLDPNLSPVVEICAMALAPTDPESSALIGTPCRPSGDPHYYQVTSGVGGLPAVTFGTDQYQVNWEVPNDAYNVYYRISARVGSTGLGIADVHSTNSGKDLKNVNSGEFIPRQDGATLPIKFRIQTGIVGGVTVSPGSATIPVGGVQAFTGAVTDLHGALLAGATPIWSSSAALVAEVDASGNAVGVTVGTAQITASAGGLTGSALLTVTPAGPTGVIAIMSTRFGDYKIVIMNADGTDARLVTSFVPQDDQPVPDLSPDRSTVVFASGSQVWKADVTTGAVTQLTFEGSYTRYAKWSPDGQKIAFNSLRGSHNIYTMNPDGSGVQQITNDPEDEGHPTWSPDGQRITFVGIRGGQQQIYVVDIATGVERQVTFDPGIHGVPRWAPTGSLVAYVNNGNNAIWVVDVDSGSPPTQVTPTGGAAGDGPGWSPDGKHLIFGSSLVYGHPQLWMVDRDGANLHLFIPTPFNDGWPSWR